MSVKINRASLSPGSFAHVILSIGDLRNNITKILSARSPRYDIKSVAEFGYVKILDGVLKPVESNAYSVIDRVESAINSYIRKSDDFER